MSNNLVNSISNSFRDLSSTTAPFKLLHQNIRSLRQNYDSLICNIQTLSVIPKLIFLSEIWIKDQELANFSITGYKLFANCNNNYRAGGVAVYVSDGLNVKINNDFNLKTADLLSIDLYFPNFKVTIVCVYRLQSFNIDVFLDEFDSVLIRIKSNNLLVLGDMNINILNNSEIVDNYNFLMSSHGLTSDVNVPTRISNISSTCIDHVFYRCSDVVINSSVEDLCITDHCAIFVNFLCNDRYMPSNRKVNDRNKILINFDKLNNLLLMESWSSVLSQPDISSAFDLFFSTLSKYISRCEYVARPNRKFLKLKPWMNNALLFEINKKNLLSRTLKKHSSNLELKKQYYMFVKQVNKSIAEAKNKYYLSKFQRATGNSKQQWSLLNEILNNDSAISEIDQVLDEQNNRISSSVDMANAFNYYFHNTVSQARNEFIDNSRLSDSLFLFDNSPNRNCFFRPISPTELFFIINSLEDKNSKDLFGLSSAIIKKIKFNIVDILCTLFNRSINDGNFPKSLKVATVIPLFKKGDRVLISNYRPISILSVTSKIFEKAVKTRMLEFLNSFNYFSSSQFGFRSGLGTEDALLELMNPLHEGLNKSSTVSALFVDITKAFDMVDHSILLNKLCNIGFRGCILNWFNSFITNRSQKVKCKNSFSESLILEAGVPQGSVLGPILFLIYINSIFKQDFKGKVVAFADDMAFAYNCCNYPTSVSHINQDLEILRNWFGAHKLLLSSKTKAMLFNLNETRSFNEDLIYHHYCCSRNGLCADRCLHIESVECIKYLGLNVDCNLNWKHHMLELKNSLHSGIRKMYLLRPHCLAGVLKIFYHALIESRLSYGICCWGGTYYATLKPLIIAQKHIIRLMHFRNKRSPSWPLFLVSNILPLRHLYIFKVMKVYFVMSGNRNLSCYPLRNNNMFFKNVPKFFKTHFSNYFLVSAPTIFNKLPIDIRSLSSKGKFISCLRVWLLQFSSVNFIFDVII
jgi:hypothetical protein